MKDKGNFWASVIQPLQEPAMRYYANHRLDDATVVQVLRFLHELDTDLHILGATGADVAYLKRRIRAVIAAVQEDGGVQ